MTNMVTGIHTVYIQRVLYVNKKIITIVSFKISHMFVHGVENITQQDFMSNYHQIYGC